MTTLFLAACSPESLREVDEESSTSVASRAVPQKHMLIMDRIEQQVQLPANAQKLAEYARYYASDGERVVAIYTTHVGSLSGDQGLLAGERGWVADRRDLPVILDGGCSVVNIVFDAVAQNVEQAFCNGVA